jgi:hypothetical protein
MFPEPLERMAAAYVIRELTDSTTRDAGKTGISDGDAATVESPPKRT